MSEYDNLYTIEFYGNKGWEVCWRGDKYMDAVLELSRSSYVLNQKVYLRGDIQLRLTTPKVEQWDTVTTLAVLDNGEIQEAA
jgi:hypothetical protein